MDDALSEVFTKNRSANEVAGLDEVLEQLGETTPIFDDLCVERTRNSHRQTWVEAMTKMHLDWHDDGICDC